MTLSPEEKTAIAALKRLAKKWPPSLWIFADGQSLSVLKTNDQGDRVMTRLGCVDPDFEVASLDIPNDGGDW